MLPSGYRRGHVFGASLVVALSLWTSGPAQGSEACYLLMFSTQRDMSEAQHGHSIATFVKVCWPERGACPAQPTLEVCTISWLPRKLPVRPLALRAECGHNYNLHESISYALDHGQHVCLWGPFQIRPELYDRAVAQVALLSSGKVKYKAIDSGFRSQEVSNCMHAISCLAEGHCRHFTSPGWGEMGSYHILRQMKPWIIDEAQVHPWVGSALGLDDYPIVHADVTVRPRSASIYGLLYRLLGGERDWRLQSRTP